MLRLLIALFVACALVLGPHTAFAEIDAELNAENKPGAQEEVSSPPADASLRDAPPSERAFFGQEHRREIYEASRLSQTRAVLYSLALPGIGNFYAEQYATGTIALSSFVFSAMFLAYGLMYGHPDLVRLGIGLGAVTYIGSTTLSVFGVRAYNDRLRRSLHIEEAHNSRPTESFAGLHFSWQF